MLVTSQLILNKELLVVLDKMTCPPLRQLTRDWQMKLNTAGVI